MASSRETKCYGCTVVGIICTESQKPDSSRTRVDFMTVGHNNAAGDFEPSRKLTRSQAVSIRSCPVVTPDNVFRSPDEDSFDGNEDDKLDTLGMTKRELADLLQLLEYSDPSGLERTRKIILEEDPSAKLTPIIVIEKYSALTAHPAELSEAELLGIDSEERIADILFDSVFDEIIDRSKNIEHSPANSHADQHGIDFLVHLNNDIARLLGKDALVIQVKSSQGYLEKAVLGSYSIKQGKKPKYAHRDSLEQCFIYCNGQHAKETIISSIIMQLAALIWERSGTKAFEKFSALIAEQTDLYLIFQRIYAQDILARDYGPIADGIMHSSQERNSGIPETTRADRYVELISAGLLGIDTQELRHQGLNTRQISIASSTPAANNRFAYLGGD